MYNVYDIPFIDTSLMTHGVLRLRSIPHEDELSIKIVRGAGHYSFEAAADLRRLGVGEQSKCREKCCPDHHNQGGTSQHTDIKSLIHFKKHLFYFVYLQCCLKMMLLLSR